MYFCCEDDCCNPLFRSCDFRLTFLSILVIISECLLQDEPK